MNGRIPSNKLKLLQAEQHAALDANLAYRLSLSGIWSRLSTSKRMRDRSNPDDIITLSEA